MPRLISIPFYFQCPAGTGHFQSSHPIHNVQEIVEIVSIFPLGSYSNLSYQFYESDAEQAEADGNPSGRNLLDALIKDAAFGGDSIGYVVPIHQSPQNQPTVIKMYAYNNYSAELYAHAIVVLRIH